MWYTEWGPCVTSDTCVLGVGVVQYMLCILCYLFVRVSSVYTFACMLCGHGVGCLGMWCDGGG